MRVIDADAMLGKITELRLTQSIHKELFQFVRESALPDPAPREHVLYERGDAGVPYSITDGNGDIALGLCKVCGRGEIDLELDGGKCPGAPLKRLEWTRFADGTLRSDKVGEAWFTFYEGTLCIWSNERESEAFGRSSHSFECFGIKLTERYLHALGLGPASPDPWTPPVIKDEAKPDPVEEIRERMGTYYCNAGARLYRDLETLLNRIDELQATLAAKET